MPATALDSLIFRDIFTTEAMRRVFSDEQRTAYYLGDRGGARARAGPARHHPGGSRARDRGQVPDREHRSRQAQAADRAHRLPDPRRGAADRRDLRRRTRRMVPLGRDHPGHHRHRNRDADPGRARSRRGRHGDDRGRARGACAALSPDTPMAGRSNLQQAVPITFGFKAASLLAAFQRHRQRLAQLRPRVLVGEFAGAAGTLASLGTDGLKVQAALMQELKLGQPEIAWHTVRDRIGEVGCFLGLLTGTLGKIAMDVKLLMQTEVAEAFEPFAQGRGSSSTMPQKRNPISVALYPRRRSVGAPARGGTAGGRGRRS